MKYAVNLLPPHLRPQTGLRPRHAVLAAVLLVFIIIGSMHGYLIYKKQDTMQNLARVNQELGILAPTIQQIDANKRIQAQIATRENVLKQIQGERPLKWSETLIQLGQATPANLWLIQISSEANGVVKIRGGATDIDKVTQYINTLRNNPAFADVTFLGLVQGNLGEIPGQNSSPIRSPLNLVTYELSLVVKGSGPR